MDRADWDARYRTAELVWTAEPNRFVVAETGGLPPGRVLDLAAGEGRNAVWLAERGWDATAVDFSAVAIDKANALAAARGVTLTTFVADATEPLPGDGGYDLVVVAYLQLPEGERRRSLHHAATALAPGGTLVVVAHDASNLVAGVGGPQDPAVLTTPEATAGMLRAAGVPDLVIEKAELVQRPVETEAGPRVAIDHVVRARRVRSGGG